jgi:GDP-4-dehydro-6-deoxy-D-mannose reductase
VHLDDDIRNLAGIGGLRLVKGDLMDPAFLKALVRDVRPESVFHLAAQSEPSLSFSIPAETLRVNIFTTLNIFEAVLECSPSAVVLNVGSGDEYGEADPTELPLKETSELRPANPYAVSKVTQDLLAYQYWKARGIKAVRCRPFNHLGPRQREHFVASSFARQIAEIEAGGKKDGVLRTGNLDAAKDFLDVRDVVSAYDLLSLKGSYGGVYNICSGRAVKVREILDLLISLSTADIEVSQDSGRTRPGEAKVIYGDPTRLQSLGWRPVHALRDGLAALLDYWRAETAARARQAR